MKKLFLMLACALGVFTAQAQFFVGGELGLLYNKDTDVTQFTIAPELGYAFNDQWTVAGAIGYTHANGYDSFFVSPYARWTFFNKGIVGLHVDGGFGVSVAEGDAGFEIGFRPGVSFDITKNFSMVGHVGFLGFRDNYRGSSVSGLALSGTDFGVSLYYKF